MERWIRYRDGEGDGDGEGDVYEDGGRWRQLKEDEDIEIKQCKVKRNIFFLGQYIGSPMPPPTTGDADRIGCIYNSQIIFRKFFSCSFDGSILYYTILASVIGYWGIGAI